MSDRVILCGTRGVVRVAGDLMRSGAESLRQRLGWDVEVVEDAQGEKIGTAAACGSVDRVVIVPCGLGRLQLSEIRGAAWFERYLSSGETQTFPRIYLAEPLTAREVGRWLAQGACGQIQLNCNQPNSEPSNQAQQRRVRRIVLHEGMGLEEIESIALVAFWGNRLVPGGLECVSTEEALRTRVLAQEGIEKGEISLPWELSFGELSGEDFGTWLMQRVLAGVRSRPLGWEPREDANWILLCGLHDQLSRELPSEYVEKLDSVSPRSMGSAVIAPDKTGMVPWDKIWTSFCDLAMAGGPPHRGKLLEPVCIEEIRSQLDAYAAVEREIRRGIGLASGLQTVDSPYLGWVAVECQSEEMAAWLLRAILVENISVRREKSRLYLPAGPNYRVEKEIKNVITAVAKTVHYWQAHLRSRQPPKPL